MRRSPRDALASCQESRRWRDAPAPPVPREGAVHWLPGGRWIHSFFVAETERARCTELWPSGLRRLTENRVGPQGLRGFESHHLSRQRALPTGGPFVLLPSHHPEHRTGEWPGLRFSHPFPTLLPRGNSCAMPRCLVCALLCLEGVVVPEAVRPSDVSGWGTRPTGWPVRRVALVCSVT